MLLNVSRYKSKSAKSIPVIQSPQQNHVGRKSRIELLT